LILNIYDAFRSNLSMNVPKNVRMKAKHISAASNLIRLHALASLTRIEAKHVKLTSFLILFHILAK